VTTSHAPAGLESGHELEEASPRAASGSCGDYEADASGAPSDARRDDEEAGEEEIEITPEMIYEGVEEFSTQDLDVEDKDDVVKRIYRAMELRRRQCLAPPR
jgi:hypothetical protein